MILGNRKYVDPTPVLKAVTDDYGNPVLIGEQRDIGEFNLNFLERIEEGLGERKQETLESQKLDDLSESGKNKLMQAEGSSFLDDNFSQKVEDIKEEAKEEIAGVKKGAHTMKQIFFGSKVEILKLVHKDSELFKSNVSLDSPLNAPKLPFEDKLSTRVEKLGPINLDIKPGQRLYDAWDEAFVDEVQGFNPGDRFVGE